MSDAKPRDGERPAERPTDDATRERSLYEAYFRQAVEAGLRDSREGRTVPLAEARRRFGSVPGPSQ